MVGLVPSLSANCDTRQAQPGPSRTCASPKPYIAGRTGPNTEVIFVSEEAPKNMSFITALESDISKAEKVLASWWGKEPAFENVLSIGINTVGISLETVFTLENNGPASTLVGNIVSKAQQELLAVNTLVTTVGPNPASKSVLVGIATDLGGLETAANITNPKSKAAVGLAVNTVNALVNSFPATPAVPPTA